MGKIFQLYDCAITEDLPKLKHIAKEKLSDKKSDLIIGKEVQDTILFALEELMVNNELLSEEEYLELTEKYSEVKDAIDLVKMYVKYSLSLNQ